MPDRWGSISLFEGRVSIQEAVIAWLARQEVEVYLVGGCVRDRLLDRPVYDLDVAVAGDGLALARRLANHFRGAYYPLDVARGTGRAILRDKEGHRLLVDVACFRGGSLEADLADRDFTINALAASVRIPDLTVDLHGGLADLEARLIRPVSEASIRRDPIRALRAIRLAADLGFALAPETESLLRRDGPALTRVAGERVRDELARLLALPHAAPHLIRLDELGLLSLLFPELEPLRRLAQPPPHHLDALTHSLETVRALETLLNQQQAIPNIQYLLPFAGRIQAHLAQPLGEARPRLVAFKLAALLHDTGKPAARSVDENGRLHFLGHHKEGARLTHAALQRLRFNNAELHLAETIVRNHMRPLLLARQESVSARAIYRFFRETGQAGVEVLLHALADHRATYAPDAGDECRLSLMELTVRMLADYWERQAERIAPPPLIDGYDLLRELGLQPGPHIGDLLEAVREAQVSGEVHNRDEALTLVRDLWAGGGPGPRKRT